MYRDINLGTGKVEGKWTSIRKRKVFLSDKIIHHLLDFRSPKGEYNVSHFKKDCERLLEVISESGKLPIICGGTGFWISTIVDGIEFPNVKPDRKLRKKLATMTNHQLLQLLKKNDPERASSIDQSNKIRLIRAIEISKVLGSVPKIKKGKHQKYDFLLLGIDWPQDKLDQKIKKRLEGRWTAGMIKEVEQLRKKHDLSWNKIQSFGLGYFWIPEYLKKNIDLEQLKEKVFVAERRYAKRQRTWFRRDKRIVWVNSYAKIKKLAKEFLN